MLIYRNTSKLILKEGVRTDEKVALQIQLSQFMLKYSNQCFLHSILINTVRCYCFQYCVFSLTLLLTRWNVKKQSNSRDRDNENQLNFHGDKI